MGCVGASDIFIGCAVFFVIGDFFIGCVMTIIINIFLYTPAVTSCVFTSLSYTYKVLQVLSVNIRSSSQYSFMTMSST